MEERKMSIIPVVVPSILLSAVFYVVASGSGKYDSTEVFLGSLWTLSLSLIIAASVIPPQMKRA